MHLCLIRLDAQALTVNAEQLRSRDRRQLGRHDVVHSSTTELVSLGVAACTLRLDFGRPRLVVQGSSTRRVTQIWDIYWCSLFTPNFSVTTGMQLAVAAAQRAIVSPAWACHGTRQLRRNLAVQAVTGATPSVLPDVLAGIHESMQRLSEWWSGVLEAAVPKKRRSYSRKRMRHTAQAATRKFSSRGNIIRCQVRRSVRR